MILQRTLGGSRERQFIMRKNIDITFPRGIIYDFMCIFRHLGEVNIDKYFIFYMSLILSCLSSLGESI